MKLKKLKPSYLYRLPLGLSVVLLVLLASIVLIYSLVALSNPTEVGPLGVTSLFILVFVATITTLTLVKMLVARSTTVSLEGLVGIALVPTLILALGSLRQLTIIDVVLILIFAGLVNFYVRRATKKISSN